MAVACGRNKHATCQFNDKDAIAVTSTDSSKQKVGYDASVNRRWQIGGEQVCTCR